MTRAKTVRRSLDHSRSTAPRPIPGLGFRRGFTLIEMLVVIAITALLMTVLFIPLTRSLELSSRGNAMVSGQDNVRAALRRVTRDLGNAMDVYPPQDIQVWGYNAWTQNNRNKWQPAANAVPEPYLLRSGMIAFRLPRQQYYCTQGDHFVSQDDIQTKFGNVRPDLIALSECPRHPGSPVELRPTSPLRPDTRITLYFVALSSANADPNNPDGEPVWRDSQGRPVYQNPLLFGNSFLAANSSRLNTYVLYRAEFDMDPKNLFDKAFQGMWKDGAIVDQNGVPDPTFFYSTRSVTGTDPSNPNNTLTQPEWKWWADRAQRVMATDAADVVKWVDTGGKQVPHSLCTFSAAPIGNEVAQPNQAPGLYSLQGSIQPGTLPAPEYVTDNGHWLSIHQLAANGPIYDDGSTVLPDALTLPSAVPASNPGEGLFSPHIQVLERQPAGTVPIFDSQLPQSSTNPRTRLVTYDSVAGKVLFSITRRGTPAQATDSPEEWQASLDAADPLNISVQLAGDTATDANGMPASFGAAQASARYAPTLMVVPGSEVIQLEDRTAGPTPERQPFHRAGFSITGGDPNVAPNDLGLYDYTINYRTGKIIFSTEAVANWASALQANPNNVRMLIRYKFQTNQPTDVVRVSYTTRDMAVVNLGVVQYTRKLAEALPFEVAERVVVRNLKR